jgi:hypothetical protein
LGEWSCSFTILEVATRWRWMVSFMPQPLYPRGDSPRHPLVRAIGWTQEPIWTLWRREKSFAPARNQTLTVQPVATPSELSWHPWCWGCLVNMKAIMCRTIRHWDHFVSSPEASVTLSAVWPARSMWMRNIVTCRPIARQRIGEHVSVEMDSWKSTRKGFRGYGWSRNISADTEMNRVFCRSVPTLYVR